jgi:hypothetical protein
LFYPIHPAADHKAEYASFLTPRQQCVTGFTTECLEIAYGGSIGRQHTQTFPWRHAAQRPVSPEHGKRAVHAFDVQQGLAHTVSMLMTGSLGKTELNQSRLNGMMIA